MFIFVFETLAELDFSLWWPFPQSGSQAHDVSGGAMRRTILMNVKYVYECCLCLFFFFSIGYVYECVELFGARFSARLILFIHSHCLSD